MKHFVEKYKNNITHYDRGITNRLRIEIQLDKDTVFSLFREPKELTNLMRYEYAIKYKDELQYMKKHGDAVARFQTQKEVEYAINNWKCLL